MADVIVDTMRELADVVTGNVNEDVDTQHTAMKSMTETLGATAEGAASGDATTGREAQLDAIVRGREDDTSPSVHVESTDHAKNGVEHDEDGAHETSKGQTEPEAADSKEPVPRENMLDAVAGKLDATTEGTDPEDTTTGEVQHIDAKMNGEDDTSPGVYVEITEHAGIDAEHVEDSALREEQESQQGQDEHEPIPKEPTLDDSNPYGLDTISKGAEEGLPTGEVTTRVEQHPVVLEEVKPITDVEDTQAQAQGEDSPAAEPLPAEVEPTMPVSDAKSAEDDVIHTGESPAHQAIAQEDSHLDTFEEVKPQDEATEGEVTEEIPTAAEDDLAKEVPVEGVDEKEEAPVKTEEIHSTTTTANDLKNSEEDDELVVPTTEPESRPQAVSDTASELEKTEAEDHLSVEPAADGQEDAERHEAEAEGGSHVEPTADPVDHQDDPEVEGTKDAVEALGKEGSVEPQFSEPSEPATQERAEASDLIVLPTTAKPGSEVVEETEGTEEKSADVGEHEEASRGTEETPKDDTLEGLTVTEPEKDEPAEVQKDDEHDAQEVLPIQVLASEASAPDHVHEDEEEIHDKHEVLDDQPTDVKVKAVSKSSVGSEEPEEKDERPHDVKDEEPPHEEKISENVEALGNVGASTEQAAAVPMANDKESEDEPESSPVADDAQAAHQYQDDSSEVTKVSVGVVEAGPSQSTEETKSSTDEDGEDHGTGAEISEAKALPAATEPELESEFAKTEPTSRAPEDDAPASLFTGLTKEEAEEAKTVDVPIGSFDQTKTETDMQEGDAPIANEDTPILTEEPKEPEGTDEAHVEAPPPASVLEPIVDEERTVDEEVGTVQVNHEAAEDATPQLDTTEASATQETVAGVEAKTERSDEVEDATPAELITVEPETKEGINDTPGVVEEDADATKEAGSSDVTQPETEESPAASVAPTHVEAGTVQSGNSDEDDEEEPSVPVVSVTEEDESSSPAAQPAEEPIADVAQVETSAVDPEIEPLTEEHKEEAFEAVPVDSKDGEAGAPQVEVVAYSLPQVSQDAATEPIAVPPVHLVEASSKEVHHVEAVHSEAREETELEKPDVSDSEAGVLTQPSEVVQETLVEVNRHTEPEPSTVPAEEEPQSVMKGSNDPEAELTASIEPPAPTEVTKSADSPFPSEDAVAVDLADVTNNGEVSPPTAEIPSVHEAVPGPSTAETLLDEEGQKNKEFGSALDVGSTTISEAVQDSKDEEAAAPKVTSLDNPESSALEGTDPEKVDNITVLSASISEPAHAAGEIVDPESTSTLVESGSTVQVEDNTEDPTITANEEAVRGDDSQEAIEDTPVSLEVEKETTTLKVDPQRSESVDLAEQAVLSVDTGSNNEAVSAASLKVETAEMDSASPEPYSGPGEREITAPSQEQDVEGQASETVKELVDGEKDVVTLTAGQEEAQPPEENQYDAELHADKDIAVQESPDEVHKELPAERAPEPAGAEAIVVDEATGAVEDAVQSTTDQTGRLIVPETLELVSGDNAQATEETTHADEEQPSTPAALEETFPHASREDPSAGTHEQSSESATEASISEESVPEVTIELPTPSNENFTYEDELNASDTEELPDVLEKDIPSVTTAPESADQARRTPTIVIPEVSKSVERTEGESATPKESTALGNETPTTVHEIDEAATTPTEPLVEVSAVSMAEQSDDAIRMQSIENSVKETDVTESTVREAAAHEHSVEEISLESQVADFDKHEAEHAESISDSAQEYEANEPSVTIDVQEATTDAASSESLEDSEIDVPHVSPRALSIDTSVQDLPERPKSPWTPSYSVTQQGPGTITQPAEDDVLQNRVEIADSETGRENEFQIDEGVPAESEIPAADPVELQRNDERAKTPENIEVHSEDESVTPKKGKEGQDNTTPTKSVDIERPKSPYPPSYSVTQMGQKPSGANEQRGFDELESEAVMFDPLTRNLSEKLSIITPRFSADEEEGTLDGTSSEAASDVPEVPMSPRSDLGIFTPSFDSRSEISVASHEPIAPSSPRIDPEEPIFPDSAMRTPIGKVPAHVDTVDSALSTDASESITPLPAPLVPLHGVYMPTKEVKEPEVSTAEEPGSDTLQVTAEKEDLADDDDATKSVVSESLSGLTTDSDIEAASTDGRLTTIPPSEARTEVDSEVDSSAFDGDIESHHPASSIDSLDSDSWAQDTDVERASLPDTDNVHAERGRTSSEGEQSEPEIVEDVESSQSVSEISESEAHESPVLVATPKNEPAPSEAGSEFEAISNPGVALTLKEFSDSMSELDTIRDDSTHAGPIEDMPNIPSSVSQLAIPELDEGSGAPTPRPESPTADSSLSLDYADSDANASFGFVSVAKHTETDLTTADEEDHTLMMPKIDPQGNLDSDTGSIEPLDDDTVRQHLSDAPSSPAEPAEPTIFSQSVEPEPTLFVNKQLPELPAFPTIVTPSEPGSSVSPKAFPGGLVALDEESSVSDFIPVSPTLGVRRRLESTASSLVFPGAWVASPIPPERASLEVATGEFSRPPLGEFSRSNSGASPDSTPLVTPTTEDEEKRRCIIM